MSRESILRDLPDYLIAQMRSWAETGESVGHYSISQYDGMPMDTAFGSRPPSMGGEASHIERALDLVANRERQAVRWFWLYEPESVLALTRRLHLTDTRTTENRVNDGHQQLRQHLARLEAQFDRMLDSQPMLNIA